jgi:hypothetical protein
LAVGHPELAQRIVREVDPVHPVHECALLTARALLVERDGGYAEARELFTDATGRWDRFEMPWERAQALLGRARCLLALGRRSEAAPPLRLARDVCASLGASSGMAEADARLHEAGAVASEDRR